ncbi:disease resistance protein RGA5 [Setaria viridis]|uniref:disease resistance protein RGA5 n=1 Tax=Setaria viridis TaxID=4556 RepID=UPI001493BA38|nr:disease resistance protein PIK6-NP-like isoform X1 [Setaria viridis]XP_034600904.1 disease resistance protein PIK6-NP-like isoform X1 [Setaria viridis]
MEALSFADSLRLFCKRAFGSEELRYPHLKEVCYGILEKCGGLPLAIITLSSLLADNLAEDEWCRVLTGTGRELAKDPNAGNMTSILSLSYFDLHYLRTCFLYLSVFAEDFRIGKQRLINRWIAEGFIYEDHGRSVYEIGESYFSDLANRSLIQPVDITYGEAQACRVHDIILDFITSKATEENFVTPSLHAAEHGKISDYRVRRLFVDARHGNNVTIPSSLIISKARSLTIFGYPLQTSLLASRALRALDLGDCWGLKDHHLANIEKLFNLRYLCLGSKSITELPWKIGDMQCLETLDLRHLPPRLSPCERHGRCPSRRCQPPSTAPRACLAAAGSLTSSRGRRRGVD